MDNDFGLDIAEIIKTVRTAEVITFRFLTVSERLLVDMRANELDGPMLTIVPRASSAEERFRGLKKLRPRFPVPEQITSIWWPRYMQSLTTSGVWNAALERVAQLGHPQVSARATKVFEQLIKLEREEIRKAITGKGYQTLWEKAV